MARDPDNGGAHREHREYPVVADEPLLLNQPRRAVRRAAILFAVAMIVCSAAAAYIAATIAHERAGAHTDRRFAVLERDLNERRRAAAEQNARRDAQAAEVRRLVCVFADRAWPRDAEVERVRNQFGCTANPTPPPPTGREPGARPGGRPPDGGPAEPRSRVAPPPARPGPVAPRPTPAPAPPITVPPVRQPDPPVGPPPRREPILCLPILGCIL